MHDDVVDGLSCWYFLLTGFQGVTRVKSSSDVVGALLRELRLQVGSSTDGAFRLAVAVDGVNALWGRTTLKKEDKSEVLHFSVHIS